MLYEVVAVLLVQVDDDFRIGMGIEAVALRLELRTQLDVVEDLAVEDDPYCLVFVVDRLPATLEVDDAQPRVRQPDLLILVKARSIGTAVMQARDHLGELFTPGRRIR